MTTEPNTSHHSLYQRKASIYDIFHIQMLVPASGEIKDKSKTILKHTQNEVSGQVSVNSDSLYCLCVSLKNTPVIKKVELENSTWLVHVHLADLLNSHYFFLL